VFGKFPGQSCKRFLGDLTVIEPQDVVIEAQRGEGIDAEDASAGAFAGRALAVEKDRARVMGETAEGVGWVQPVDGADGGARMERWDGGGLGAKRKQFKGSKKGWSGAIRVA
jgi:hypothetical protein